MKIRTLRGKRAQGSALVVTLLTTLVVGVTLASYLLLISSQNVSTMRSQAWNSGIPVLEAGAEEAMTHLHYRGITNLNSDGWSYATSPFGNGYQKTRFLGQSCYMTLIIPVNPPVIYAISYVPVPLSPNAPVGSVFATVDFNWYGQAPGYVSRRAKLTTFRNPMFTKALVAKGAIDMNGNNVTSDSFDSMDPKYSTGGVYDKTKSKDNGDVATTSGIENAFTVGNANIKGHISTGPGGSVDIGPNGSVGDAAWVNAGKPGIETGHYTDDMNAQFPDVGVPFTSGYSTPTSGAIGTTNYNYVLGSGKYLMNTMSGTIYVGGNAVLYVPGTLNLSGITIGPTGSLLLYNGTETGSPQSVSISGNGVVNATGKAWNFQFYGLPSVTKISITGNGTLTGTIYAPEAALTLKGSGSGVEDFSGAGVANSVTMNGHFNFHYDEALARFGPIMDYRVLAWNEF